MCVDETLTVLKNRVTFFIWWLLILLDKDLVSAQSVPTDSALGNIFQFLQSYCIHVLFNAILSSNISCSSDEIRARESG